MRLTLHGRIRFAFARFRGVLVRQTKRRVDQGVRTTITWAGEVERPSRGQRRPCVIDWERLPFVVAPANEQGTAKADAVSGSYIRGVSQRRSRNSRVAIVSRGPRRKPGRRTVALASSAA